jgi:RNA polymerase sigma-70 factor (ECF subfamily)
VTKDPSVTVEAIEAVYRQRFHRFVQVAEAVCGDPELARDAVQEAFASAIRTRSGFRGEARLESWLWRCVLNAARKTHRGKLQGLTAGAISEQLVAANGHSVESSGLRQALARLPERQRQVLFLRHFADLDYASIAEALEISAGTVGATLNQAHAALRRLLEEVLP